MGRANLIAATVILVAALPISTALAGDVASASPEWVYDYHAVIPLGEDALLLHPSNQPLFLLASAHSIAFENWRQTVVADKRRLEDRRDGGPVRTYPRFVDFRVTISARAHAIPDVQPFSADSGPKGAEDINQFLLNLHFRVKVFRALRTTVIEPKIVKLIGVPADVPYDERVYRLSFDLGDLPLEDRIVLEVLSPDGERITKFHLDM